MRRGNAASRPETPRATASGPCAAVRIVISITIDHGTGYGDREAGSRHGCEVLLSAGCPVTARPWAQPLAPRRLPGGGQLLRVADAAGACRKFTAHALRGECRRDGPRRATAAPERCSPRLGETPVVNQPGTDATRDDILERSRMRCRVFAMVAAAQRDLSRQHPAQLRGRRGVTFEVMHRRPLEIVWRNPPRCPGGACTLPPPVAFLCHASRKPVSAGRP